MRMPVEEHAVEAAMREAPQDTRAAVRGACLERFPEAVLAAQWDHVVLRTSRGPFRVDLTGLFEPSAVRERLRRIRSAADPDALAASWNP
jgi:proteasome accessory factor A